MWSQSHLKKIPHKNPTAMDRRLIANVKELSTSFNQLCKAEKKIQICLPGCRSGYSPRRGRFLFWAYLGRKEIDHLCIEVLKTLNHSFGKSAFNTLFHLWENLWWMPTKFATRLSLTRLSCLWQTAFSENPCLDLFRIFLLSGSRKKILLTLLGLDCKSKFSHFY